MRRTDLSETERRQVLWKRRRAAREVGGMVDKLVDVYEPPDEFLVELGELMRRYDDRIAAAQPEYRDAA